jgi:hypothetical protein
MNVLPKRRKRAPTVSLRSEHPTHKQRVVGFSAALVKQIGAKPDDPVLLFHDGHFLRFKLRMTPKQEVNGAHHFREEGHSLVVHTNALPAQAYPVGRYTPIVKAGWVSIDLRHVSDLQKSGPGQK